MRVLITGLGGELATRVALLLEGERSIDALLGFDVDPPRKRLHRTEFHRLDSRDRRRVATLVREWRPTAVVHLAIDEPDARTPARAAPQRTHDATVAALGAAAEGGALERVVLRSGIEVYGRARGAVMVPDEDVPPAPTSPFGRMLLDAERVAAAAATSSNASLAALRFAPIVGPHYPSPLGRLLRLPVVPVSLLADPPFSLLHQEDAARAIVAALLQRVDEPVNVVGAGAVTAWQAALLGGRVPLPMLGFEWPLVRRVTEFVGAPMPAHVLELLHRGRTADGGRAERILGLTPEHLTPDTLADLFEWAPVTALRVVSDEEAA
jgi:UDP-glucose 4-epimerase